MMCLFSLLPLTPRYGMTKKAQKVEDKKHWAAAGFENTQAKGFSAGCQREQFHHSQRLGIKSTSSQTRVRSSFKVWFCLLRNTTANAVVPMNGMSMGKDGACRLCF